MTLRPNAAAMPCPPSPYRSVRTQIIAHASGDFFGPPNTIEMMRAARSAGADVLDADVRITADGELVAAHDDVVRIGNIATSIERSSLAEVRSLDLGDAWPGPKGDFALRDAGFRVPTIEELLVAFPGERFSLEMKVPGGEATLCALLRRTKRTRDVYVSSAGDKAIDRFRPICPEVTTTVTDALVPVMQDARRRGLRWCSPIPIGQPPLRRGKQFRLTAESVRWDQRHGLAVFTWTADDLASLEHVATLGVDGVYTARPDLARPILSH